VVLGGGAGVMEVDAGLGLGEAVGIAGVENWSRTSG
jgi:hypothetical protein